MKELVSPTSGRKLTVIQGHTGGKLTYLALGGTADEEKVFLNINVDRKELVKALIAEGIVTKEDFKEPTTEELLTDLPIGGIVRADVKVSDGIYTYLKVTDSSFRSMRYGVVFNMKEMAGDRPSGYYKQIWPEV